MFANDEPGVADAMNPLHDDLAMYEYRYDACFHQDDGHLKLLPMNLVGVLRADDDSGACDQQYDRRKPTGDGGHYVDVDSLHYTHYDTAKIVNCDDDKCYPNDAFVPYL